MTAFIIVETDMGQRDHALPEVFYGHAKANAWCETLRERFGRSYHVLGLADPTTIQGVRP